MHSRNVESEGCYLMFYGAVGMEVDCRDGCSWFSIYVYFEVWLRVMNIDYLLFET